MTRLFNFVYSINGLQGSCRAASVSSAIDKAKNNFLSKHFGLDHNHSKFRPEKSKLVFNYIKLDLDAFESQRFKELYRCAKDGCLSAEESKEFEQTQSLLNDKRLRK